ncbi:MAG: hypothetical protein M0P31_15585 [Solirubrobacteraceae bacterium]|nr:hypothetical protein [Solirubrobacteraceae bacterium]
MSTPVGITPTAPVVPAPATARRRTLARAGAAISALMIAGGVGPWVETSAGTIYGYDRDGAIYIGMGAILLVALLLRGVKSRWPSILALIFGVVGVVAAVIDLESIINPEGLIQAIDPEAGWALYLATVTSVAITVVAVALLATRRDPR